MDLMIYTDSECRERQGGAQVGLMNIHRRGRVKINSFIARQLHLAVGGRMLIARDKDSRNDWYVSFGDSIADGYKMTYLNADHPERGLVAYYGRRAIDELLSSIKAESSATLLVGTNNPRSDGSRLWYRILTATPKHIR